MTDEMEQGPARLVRPWYAWNTPSGTLFRTAGEARLHMPTQSEFTMPLLLLRQYRFEDDGEFCGIAEPVR